MNQIKLLADQNLSWVTPCFERLANIKIEYFDGYSQPPTRVQLARNNWLIVRSVTQVNEALLVGSSIELVATATSGMEHVDEAYLKSQGIKFFSAAGSNSEAVKDYVLWVILKYLAGSKRKIADLSVGVVGVGHVGKKVASALSDMNVKVVLYDPPLKDELCNANQEPSLVCGQRNSRKIGLRDKEDLYSVDILTFHTPMIREGKYTTQDMFDEKWWRKVKSPTLLINSARGEIISEGVLRGLENQSKLKNDLPELLYAFDVWRDEPNPSVRLVGHSLIATPHIAGHSKAAKYYGVEHLYRAIRKSFGVVEEENCPIIEPALYQVGLGMDLGHNLLEEGKNLNLELLLYSLIKPACERLESANIQLRKLNGRDITFNSIRKRSNTRPEFKEIKLSHFLKNRKQEISHQANEDIVISATWMKTYEVVVDMLGSLGFRNAV